MRPYRDVLQRILSEGIRKDDHTGSCTPYEPAREGAIGRKWKSARVGMIWMR
jgi:hypothetical protein